LRRAARRPALTLAWALLAAAILFAWQLRRPPVFAVRAELLMRENTLSSDRQTFSRTDLRSFVEEVAFTSSHLEEVMARYRLFRTAANLSPVLALTEMRKSIEVEILQDYFAEYRLERSAPRSVRIAITFRGDEPEQAALVARDLGMLVTRAELGRQSERARRDASMAHAAAAQVREEEQRTEAQLAALHAAWLVHPAATTLADRVRAGFLRATLAQLERQRSEAERQETALELAAAAEEKQAGTRVHLAALQAEGGVVRNDEQWLRRKAAMSGAAGLVLALLFVGAFNPRLYDADDIGRAGSVGLGTVHNPRAWWGGRT